MALSTEDPSRTTIHPSRYIEEYGFRSTRLNVKDLRAVAAEVEGASQRWMCFVPEALTGPDHVRRRSLTEWSAESLDELIEVAPSGRIFHFKLEVDADGAEISLTMGGPWIKTHRSIVAVSHGPGVDVPPSYQKIADVVHASAKRARFWHYLSAVAYTAAIFAASFLALFVFYFLKLTAEKNHTTGKGLGTVGLAVMAIIQTSFLVLILSPLWMDGFKRLTASSVRLKPHVVTRRAWSTIRHIWTWVRSVYSRDGSLEYRAYLATNLGWIFGAASLIVAILAWLYPRGQ